MARVIAQKITTMFINKLVEHMMNSERVILSTQKKMYIGVMPKRKQGEYANRYLNFHTMGKIYGIKLEGVDMKRYHFKMAPKQRKELQSRLLKGQEFYE